MKATASIEQPDGVTLLIHLSGKWKLGSAVPAESDARREIESRPATRRLAFDSRGLAGWDTSLVVYVSHLNDLAKDRSLEIDTSGLPDGLRKLLRLATAVPAAHRSEDTTTVSFLEQIGHQILRQTQSVNATLEFIGEVVLSWVRFFRGKARFRSADFVAVSRNCTITALPIVSLISFLVGMILAFVGAVQLQQFGAQIYVANLIAVGVTREMGALMTGIIMAGRTGAAFAAHIGTMTVNEEVDALKTMGISPIDYLVLPRTLALAIAMPLLAVYANFMGLLGGGFIGLTVLGLPVRQYYNQTLGAIGLNDIAVGLIKAAVFGILIALTGCLGGVRCGRSASAVGDAATQAVVTSILLIIVADAMFTVIFMLIGF